MGLREEAIEAAADAMVKADCGYRLTLVRLVDGISTYELCYGDGERLEFDDMDEAYLHIAHRKRIGQATAAFDAALAVLSNPDEAMINAGEDVMIYDEHDIIRNGAELAFRAMLSTLAPDKALP